MFRPAIGVLSYWGQCRVEDDTVRREAAEEAGISADAEWIRLDALGQVPVTAFTTGNTGQRN
ncbi:MAG: hypothetical protein ACR2KM_05420 [Gemmatimonadaceae bacterium]